MRLRCHVFCAGPDKTSSTVTARRPPACLRYAQTADAGQHGVSEAEADSQRPATLVAGWLGLGNPETVPCH